MHKVVPVVLLSAFFGVAHAGSDNNQLFECMDAKTFEMNSECIADNISSNVAFRETQTKITQKAANSGDYVLATMKLDPQKMQIEVIAHQDATLSKVSQTQNHIAKR